MSSTGEPDQGAAGPAAPPADARGARVSRGLRRRLAVGAAAGIAVYVAFGLYSDFRALGAALREFPWRLIPLVLLLTLGNYAGRLLKWHWYMRLVGSSIALRDSARVFGVGMTMVLTPGKAGELLKSYMVRNVDGTPMRLTAPAVLVERLTDGLAMVLLAGIGLFSLGDAELVRLTGLFLGLMVAAVLLIQIRPVALFVLGCGRRVPLVRRYVAPLREAYESSYLLLRPRVLLIAVVIGTLSWSLEGVAYFVVLVGIGVEASRDTLLAAVFIFSIANILGAMVGTPGGLGGTEAGLVALSRRLLGLTRADATAASLIIRLATLWFGVLLGLICLARWPELMEGAESSEARPPEAGSASGPDVGTDGRPVEAAEGAGRPG